MRQIIGISNHDIRQEQGFLELKRDKFGLNFLSYYIDEQYIIFGYSVQEILDAAHRATGKEIPTAHGPRRDGDPAKLFANSEKVQSELGWKPQWTDVDAVIATAWRWHTEHPDGYRGE